MNKTLLCASLALVIAGCGGGGGEAGAGGGNFEQGPPPVSGPIQSTPNGTYADARRTEAFQRVNDLRRMMGLGLLKQNSMIDVAAQSHAAYIAKNRITGHVEEPGKPGYTGATIVQRMLAAGYDPAVGGEVATNKPASATDQVNAYINSLYHRIPFVAYNYTDIGVGSAQSTTDSTAYISVLDFAYPFGTLGQESPSTPYVVWPLRNATIDKGTMEPEVPAPPGVGYPVTISFDPRMTVSTSRFELREAGTSLIPGAVLTSSNDPNKLIPASMIALMPRDGLNPASSFTAIWEGTVDGVPVTVNWGFTTK